MSRYAYGKEPSCPVRSPECQGTIADRGGKQCRGCYGFTRKQEKRTKAIEKATAGTVSPDSVTESGNERVITKSVSEKVKTLADLIRVCEIDTDEWEITRWVANAYPMGYTGQKKQAHSLQLYQVKAWLKPRVEILSIKAEIASLIADAKKQVPRITVLRKAPAREGLLFIPAIPDLHVGKLAWGKETGHQNYDTALAVQCFEDALDALIQRAAGYTFAQVVFPVGNDLMNSDNAQNTTTGGTPQSTDGRYQKTFVTVRRMITRAIGELLHLAPVEVIIVPGNHDQLAAWHLGDSLECFFHNTKGVTVNNAPTLRKYVEFGQNMLMFTHGNKGKKPDYPLVMATEQKAMFGRTTYREAHTGHFHKSSLDEFHGVKVRVSPALCPPDAWHAEHQFVGRARAAEGYVYDREHGPISTVFYTVPEEK